MMRGAEVDRAATSCLSITPATRCRGKHSADAPPGLLCALNSPQLDPARAEFYGHGHHCPVAKYYERPESRGAEFACDSPLERAVWSELVSVKIPCLQGNKQGIFHRFALSGAGERQKRRNISGLRPNSLRIPTGNFLRSNTELNRAIREFQSPSGNSRFRVDSGRFRARKNAISRSDLPGIAPVRLPTGPTIRALSR